MNKRLQVFFNGQVQGVGFRFSVRALAHEMGIRGWVRNLPSGDVEVVAQASKECLEAFLGRIEEQFSGYISDKKMEWQSATEEFKTFEIRF